MLLRAFFDHEIGFKMDLPVQDDANMKQTVFFDLKVRRERVFVPAEKDAGGDGFDVHGRCFEDPSVFSGIFDHFFVEHLVLAPASYGVKFIEAVGEGRHIEITPNEAGGVAILFAGVKILAHHELKKTYRIAGHGQILMNPGEQSKRRTYSSTRNAQRRSFSMGVERCA